VHAFIHAHEALRRLAAELTERGEDRMPAERVLAERLGTSRTTVRKALEMLEEAGTIHKVKGRAGGAYLTSVRASGGSQPLCSGRGVMRSLNTVKGIPDILQEQGFCDGTSVLRAGLATVRPEVCRTLGLGLDEPAVSLLRLRHADGETLSLERMYLRPELGEVLRSRMNSVYRTLVSEQGVRIASVDESIEIAALSRADSELLGRPAGTPVLKLVRTGYDQSGRALEYSVDLFRADRTRLHVHSAS
jgi:GntR family transcriptional regulator